MGRGSVPYYDMVNLMSALRIPRSRLRRAMACVVTMLQLVLVLAPLAEDARVNGAAGSSAGPGSTVTSAVSAAVDLNQPVHNELTCPACIARSLHARPELGSVLSLILAPDHASLRSAPISVIGNTPQSLHQSRAPPVAA